MGGGGGVEGGQCRGGYTRGIYKKCMLYAAVLCDVIHKALNI
jgi:hypothetical protein